MLILALGVTFTIVFYNRKHYIFFDFTPYYSQQLTATNEK